MKKILSVLLSLFVASVLLLNIVSAKSEPESDLFKMTAILKDENILINQWSLHARQNVKSDYEDQKEVLMKQFPGLEWKISQDEDKWEASAIFSKEKGVNETIRILSTGSETYLIYEVHGTSWNENAKKYVQEKVTRNINDIFHENVTVFSCVIGEFGDKMNESLPVYANALLTAFQAQELEKLEESSFISASAYTPLFQESIEGTSGAMNLQVGIREEGLGGKTTVVVGTPIITIEY